MLQLTATGCNMEGMTSTDEPPRWVSRNEAADIAHVHVRTIDNMLSDGRLTKHKNGFGRVRIDRSELLRQMEHSVSSEPLR